MDLLVYFGFRRYFIFLVIHFLYIKMDYVIDVIS
jgi:hypothetical protein